MHGGGWVWEEVVLGCLKTAWEVTPELWGHKLPHTTPLFSSVPEVVHDHGITESFWLEEPLKIMESNC